MNGKFWNEGRRGKVIRATNGALGISQRKKPQHVANHSIYNGTN